MNKGYSIFSQFYDSLTENVEYEKRAEYFDLVIKKHGGKENGILLDLACGTGSLSEAFDSLGYDVIGVDNSPEMLNIAMNKKYESNKNIQYVCQDMRNLDLYGCVDVTVCALDSLNHLESFSDVKIVLNNVYKFTEPGGLFIFDMNTEYKHRNILGDNTFVYDSDKVYCVWQNCCSNNVVSIFLDFFVPDENGKYNRYSEDFTEIAFPINDIKKEIENTGFEILGVYDDDSFEEVGDNSQRVVFVIRRPK